MSTKLIKSIAISALCILSVACTTSTHNEVITDGSGYLRDDKVGEYIAAKSNIPASVVTSAPTYSQTGGYYYTVVSDYNFLPKALPSTDNASHYAAVTPAEIEVPTQDWRNAWYY